MGFDEDDSTIGRWQAIQYEGIQEYCSYFRHQGHKVIACNINKRYEEYKRRKEAEEANKTKGKRTSDFPNQVNTQPSYDQAKDYLSTSVTGVSGSKDNQLQTQQKQKQKDDQQKEEWNNQRRNNTKDQQNHAQQKNNQDPINKNNGKQLENNIQSQKEVQSGNDLSLPSPHTLNKNISANVNAKNQDAHGN